MKIILAFFFLVVFSSCDEETSPRDMGGKTFLRTADSVYYITFTIDSVIPMEHEPEDRRP